ncbi:bacteriohemerythrin [Geofilum sp. OHC36d9]|uniref:bacteriohemerythrin n=1 Tax=Geofilum sp. OHC36d9 TaxID=3458413 RepID=UPI0040344F72
MIATSNTITHEEVRIIDQEHDILHRTIRLIDEAFITKQGNKRISQLISELYKFIDFHFTSEENLMLFTDFPYYDEHKKEHTELMRDLADIICAFNADMIDYHELVDYLNNRFTDHSDLPDRQLKAYLVTMIK